MLSCPISLERYPRVLMAHGGGGKLMHQLIQEMIVPAFDQTLCEQHDAAVLPPLNGEIAFTSDTFVVSPLFFVGGDIGSLSVYGTVNDLCMSGATPKYLSASFILEEGLEMSLLWRIIQSMAVASRELGIPIVTGDTKVVEKNHGDGIYINTSGIGVKEHGRRIGPASIQVGDAIIVSGDLGRHGIAIMTAREGLTMETEIGSDSAPLNNIVGKLLDTELDIHCMRDITRGGLAAVLNELVDLGARASEINMVIDEKMIPVDDSVNAVCEILGLDPINIACEGRFVLILPEFDARQALDILNHEAPDNHAAIIGNVVAGEGSVYRRNSLGVLRAVDFHLGELLPRIC